MTSRDAPRACPRCGGTDRFYFLRSPRIGVPRHQCRQCRYTEALSDSEAGAFARQTRYLEPHEQSQVFEGYKALAQLCANELLAEGGKGAREFPYSRGLTDTTIAEAGIGFYPDTYRDDMGSYLWRHDENAYRGALAGGVLGPQGKPKASFRGSITLPYYVNGLCTTLRCRKLQANEGAKYMSPSGVPLLFAGGTPSLYQHDVLSKTHEVLLSEGEFKALIAHQAWTSGRLSMPAVAQPGIAYMPDAYLDALSGKTVYLCYDSEHRSDPFRLSAGEFYTIRNGELLSGIGLRERLSYLQQVSTSRRRNQSIRDPESIMAEIDRLREAVAVAEERRISVKVVRLPRHITETKVDVDSFILNNGSSALEKLLRRAVSFDEWYQRHGVCTYRFDKGGIYCG